MTDDSTLAHVALAHVLTGLATGFAGIALADKLVGLALSVGGSLVVFIVSEYLRPRLARHARRMTPTPSVPPPPPRTPDDGGASG